MTDLSWVNFILNSAAIASYMVTVITGIRALSVGNQNHYLYYAAYLTTGSSFLFSFLLLEYLMLGKYQYVGVALDAYFTTAHITANVGLNIYHLYVRDYFHAKRRNGD